MNFDALKLDFLTFLEKEGKINLSELKAEDLDSISIFAYADKFSEYMEQKGEEINISELITELSKMDFNDGQFVQNNNENPDQTDDSSVITGLLNDMFQQQSVIDSADSDGDGKISQEEMQAFITAMGGADGENSDLSMKDILSSIESADNLEESEKPSKAEESEAADPPPGVDSGNYEKTPVGGSSSGGSGGGTGVYSRQNITPASATDTSDKTVDSIKEIEQKVTDYNEKIEQNNNEKLKVYENNEVYKQLITDLNSVTKKVDTNKSNITLFESELHAKETTIAQKEAELANIEDPKVFTEYKEEIEETRANLRKEIEQLKKEAEEIKTKLDEEKTALAENEAEKSRLDGEVEKFEKDNPNEQINEINKAIEELKADIDNLEKEKEEKQKELDEQRETEKSDAAVYGELKAYRESNEFVKYMMDLALDPETKAKYEANKSAGAYCAIFTSEITEAMYAEVIKRTGGAGMVNNGGDSNNSAQGVTGNQIAMHATAWGQKIQAALDKAGINVQATVTIRQKDGTYILTDENGKQLDSKDAVRKGLIRPGMTFEYEVNGHYHTGFIESFNEDLTWNTIEGNTTGGNVGSNVHDASYGKLSSVTDASLKAVYWMVQSGKMTKEEANRIYHINA